MTTYWPRGVVRLRHLVAAVVLGGGLVSTATFTFAQQTQPAHAPRPRGRPTRPKPADHADGGAAPARAAVDGGAGEVVERHTTDGGIRVFRFGEMEIEGRLKNPQLVFFLRRVRAEFAAGELGHRSFLRELGETKQDPNF